MFKHFARQGGCEGSTTSKNDAPPKLQSLQKIAAIGII